MPRRKSFEPEVVLTRAQTLFWERGYEATSMSALEQRMGINRFSIYETFGDKKSLFLQCLETYSHGTAAGALDLLHTPGGLTGIRQFLMGMVDAPKEVRQRGCLMMNSLVELSGRDADVDRLVAKHFRLVERSLRDAVENGKAKDEINPDVVSTDAARTLMALAHGALSLGKSEFGRPIARTAVQTVLSGLKIKE